MLVDVSTGDEWLPEWYKRQRDAEQRMPLYPMTLLAVDLARNVDYSAFLGLECNTQRITVRSIERMRRRDYNQVVDRIKTIMDAPAMKGAQLCIDKTGTGVAISDMLNEKGLAHFGVNIHGGDKTSYHRDGASVSKRELVYYLVRLLTENRIIINADAAEAQTLEREMLSFQMRANRDTGHIAYEGKGTHDDTVLSLGIGAMTYAILVRRLSKPKAQMLSGY
jgi:hypothetical protein